MKIKTIALVLLFATLISEAVIADDMSDLKAQLAAMQKQMQLMQAKLDEQSSRLVKQEEAGKEIRHQQAVREKDLEARSIADNIAGSLNVSGVVEVVANHSSSSGWSDATDEDIVLDTFELSIEAAANDWVSASILFLYEDADDDNLNVDEAFITINNSEIAPFYVSAGRLYVPFGNFESNMISDPATLTLAETREDVIQFGFEIENSFYGSAFVYNGDADEAGKSNKIDNYGLNFGYAITNDDFSLDIGTAYVNNIASSETLQELVSDNGFCAGDGCVQDYVAGMSLHAIASIKKLTLIAEYVTALDDFEANELGMVNTDKLKPRAWNIEAAYEFDIAGKSTVVALGYQDTDDMYFDTETTDFFDDAWLASVSVNIFENTNLSAEWRHASIYNEVDNARTAAAEKSKDEDFLQVKLSYEF